MEVDEEGNILGIQGAMSDTDEKFESWKEQGKYLAGCEVVDNALPPNNCYQIKKLKEVL